MGPIFLFCDILGVMAKTRNQDKEEMEMIKKYKMDDVLKITFSE